MPDGSLRIKCSFKIFCDFPQSISQAKLDLDKAIDSDEDTLIKSFANLLESGESSDVQLICGGDTFKCHKLVLATRSKVFKAMFDHDSTKEAQTNTVTITDSPSHSLRQMLNFIYTDDCEILNQNVNDLL